MRSLRCSMVIEALPSLRTILTACWNRGSPGSSMFISSHSGVCLRGTPEGRASTGPLSGVRWYWVVEIASRQYSTRRWISESDTYTPVSYTHLRAHETDSYLVCRLL